MSQTIEINIEELVLHGFSPADKYRIGNAVERQLGLLLKEQGLPSSLLNNNDRPAITAGDFAIMPNAPAASIGEKIAGTVYGGLKNT